MKIEELFAPLARGVYSARVKHLLNMLQRAGVAEIEDIVSSEATALGAIPTPSSVLERKLRQAGDDRPNAGLGLSMSRLLLDALAIELLRREREEESRPTSLWTSEDERRRDELAERAPPLPQWLIESKRGDVDALAAASARWAYAYADAMLNTRKL